MVGDYNNVKIGQSRLSVIVLMQIVFLIAAFAIVAPTHAVIFCEYNDADANYADVSRFLVRVYQSNALNGFWNNCST